MEKVYAVVYRTTKSGDNVSLFRSKAQAKVFIQESLEAYVNAMLKERYEGENNVKAKNYFPVSEKINSFKNSKGNEYSVYYGTCGGDYITSAKLIEKEIK